MQADAERQGRSAHALKALLVHLQTPMEFKRDAHGAPGVILVGGRRPKEDEQAVTHRESRPPYGRTTSWARSCSSCITLYKISRSKGVHLPPC